MNALATSAATSSRRRGVGGPPVERAEQGEELAQLAGDREGAFGLLADHGRGPGEALDRRGDQGAGVAVDERGERAEQAGHRPEGIDGRARRRRQPGGHQIAQALEPGEGGAEIGQVGELAGQVAEAGDERAEGVGAVAAVGAGERLASGGDRREDLVGQCRELRQGAGVDAEIEGRHGQLPVGPAEGG